MKKKVYFLLIISILSIISVFYLSKTYAKYVSGVDAADEARVAKWGIDITTSVDLFKDSYIYNDNEVVESLETPDENGKRMHIVAPGTKGEYKFQIVGGRPEVKYTLESNIKASDSIGRIHYKIKEIQGAESNDLGFLIGTYLTNLIADGTYDVDTEQKLTSQTYTIEWEWPYEDATDNDYNTDDTNIGKLSKINKNEDGYKAQPKVTFTFMIKAYQGEKEIKNS